MPISYVDISTVICVFYIFINNKINYFSKYTIFINYLTYNSIDVNSTT